jgi:hypothetical protein
MTDRNDRIREAAYFLWLGEGRPEDAAERHWLAAEGLLEDEPLEGEPDRDETPDERKKRSPSTTETAGSD